jgi:hypothetical protein
MPVVRVAGYLSSAGTGSGSERVFLSARDVGRAQSGIGYAILVAQPLRCCRIEKCQIDFAAVLLAKVFK